MKCKVFLALVLFTVIEVMSSQAAVAVTKSSKRNYKALKSSSESEESKSCLQVNSLSLVELENLNQWNFTITFPSYTLKKQNVFSFKFDREIYWLLVNGQNASKKGDQFQYDHSEKSYDLNGNTTISLTIGVQKNSRPPEVLNFATNFQTYYYHIDVNKNIEIATSKPLKDEVIDPESCLSYTSMINQYGWWKAYFKFPEYLYKSGKNITLEFDEEVRYEAESDFIEIHSDNLKVLHLSKTLPRLKRQISSSNITVTFYPRLPRVLPTLKSLKINGKDHCVQQFIENFYEPSFSTFASLNGPCVDFFEELDEGKWNATLLTNLTEDNVVTMNFDKALSSLKSDKGKVISIDAFSYVIQLSEPQDTLKLLFDFPMGSETPKLSSLFVDDDKKCINLISLIHGKDSYNPFSYNSKPLVSKEIETTTKRPIITTTYKPLIDQPKSENCVFYKNIINQLGLWEAYVTFPEYLYNSGENVTLEFDEKVWYQTESDYIEFYSDDDKIFQLYKIHPKRKRQVSASETTVNFYAVTKKTFPALSSLKVNGKNYCVQQFITNFYEPSFSTFIRPKSVGPCVDFYEEINNKKWNATLLSNLTKDNVLTIYFDKALTKLESDKGKVSSINEVVYIVQLSDHLDNLKLYFDYPTESATPQLSQIFVDEHKKCINLITMIHGNKSLDSFETPSISVVNEMELTTKPTVVIVTPIYNNELTTISTTTPAEKVINTTPSKLVSSTEANEMHVDIPITPSQNNLQMITLSDGKNSLNIHLHIHISGGDKVEKLNSDGDKKVFLAKSLDLGKQIIFHNFFGNTQHVTFTSSEQQTSLKQFSGISPDPTVNIAKLQ